MLAAPSHITSHRAFKTPCSRQRSGQPHKPSSSRVVFRNFWDCRARGDTPDQGWRGGGCCRRMQTTQQHQHRFKQAPRPGPAASGVPSTAYCPPVALVPWSSLKLDSGAAVLRTLFDCRLYHGRYHLKAAACLPRRGSARVGEGHTERALGDSVALDQPLVPARNTGFPNGDYPSCGRSTWRWLSAARLSSGMASTPLRAWAMIADRF